MTTVKMFVVAIFLMGTLPVIAQVQSAPSLAPVVVTAKANRDPVEKSYRKMISGMDLFDKESATAPGAVLRFKLLRLASLLASHDPIL